MKFEKYRRELNISYSLGIFPTFELVKQKSEQVLCVITHSKLIKSDDVKKLFDMCKNANIEIIEDDKSINKISNKENCFVVGVFKKYTSLQKGDKQIVLDNPSDMGNLGTIMRTMLGFGIVDLIITKPCADIFNPKVIRASMGAIFSLNIV